MSIPWKSLKCGHRQINVTGAKHLHPEWIADLQIKKIYLVINYPLSNSNYTKVLPLGQWWNEQRWMEDRGGKLPEGLPCRGKAHTESASTSTQRKWAEHQGGPTDTACRAGPWLMANTAALGLWHSAEQDQRVPFFVLGDVQEDASLTGWVPQSWRLNQQLFAECSSSCWLPPKGQC